MNVTILIVEDDADINNLLKRILENAGYDTIQAFSGTEALLCLDRAQPSLILLDLMLPGMTGEELLQSLREDKQCSIPVLILSAKNALNDKVTLLRLGADDYITKPFEPEEVAARVHAALRRSSFNTEAKTPAQTLSYKNITLDPDLRKVTVKGKELSLTVREYEILCLLIRSPEKVYSKENLYESVWHDGYYGTDHTVTVHVSNLRKKIKAADPEEEYIQSVYGIGFRLAKS